MKLRRTLLILTALLALTGCGSTTSNSTEKAPSASVSSSLTVSTPQHFAKTATWNLDQQLLQGEQVDTQFSPNNRLMVQSNEGSLLFADLGNQQVQNAQIADFDELVSTSVGFTPDGQHALILASGEKTGEGASQDEYRWVLYELSAHGLNAIKEGTLKDQNSTAQLSELGVMTIIQSAQTFSQAAKDAEYYKVSNGLSVDKLSAGEESFPNCGKGGCALPTTPLVETSHGILRSYMEPAATSSGSPRKTCLDLNAAENAHAKNREGCLQGFKTDDWSSTDSDIYPSGADPQTGAVVATNGNHILGAWKASDGSKYLFRVIDLDSPQGSQATFTGKNISAGYGASAPERLMQSPNGKYVATQNAIASTESPQGSLFDGENGTKKVSIESVDDSGTGYGQISDSENGGKVLVHADGTSESFNADTALPTGIFEKDGHEYGVFFTKHEGVTSVFTAEYTQ